MKAYLFIETGEVRNLKEGDWFLNCDGSGSIFFSDKDYNNDKRNILTRHEIEIPKKFTEVKIIAGSLCDLDAIVRIFPIPRPKVKKCQYITISADHCGRKRAEVTGWLTEDEARARCLEPEDRIYQTEIEVDE
jgi:hypothetical protein